MSKLIPLNPSTIEIQADLSQRIRQDSHQDLLINTATICEALHEFALVEATFDGSGDSGEIYGIRLYTATEAEIIKKDDHASMMGLSFGNSKIPDVNVNLVTTQHVGPGLDSIRVQATPLKEAIDQVASGIIEHARSGWDTSAGAYGTVSFDVASKTATLEYTQRFTLESTHRRVLSKDVSFEKIDPQLRLDQ